MKKTNLLDYLDKTIEKTITDYDVALDWDTKNHTIEIIVRLFAENKAHLEIDDAQGVVPKKKSLNLKMVFYCSIHKNPILMKKII